MLLFFTTVVDYIVIFIYSISYSFLEPDSGSLCCSNIIQQLLQSQSSRSAAFHAAIYHNNVAKLMKN